MHRPSCSELSIIWQCYAVQIKPLAIMLAVYFGKENLSARSSLIQGRLTIFPIYYRTVKKEEKIKHSPRN